MEKGFTTEIINEIDTNNMKALEIVKAIIKSLEYDSDSTNVNILLDAAFDYLQKNNEIFNRTK